MTTSLHHSKTPSELPQIARYSPEQTKLLLKSINPPKEIPQKLPLTKLISQESTFYQESPSKLHLSKLPLGNTNKQNQFMKNSYNPKLQTVSLGLGSPNMMEKLLQKNKKYFRADAHLKSQNNVVKNDIECLIQSMVEEKQKNDYIVLNLRDKFQTNNRSMTLNKRAFTLMRTKQRNSTKLKLGTPEQGPTCPIASVNNFKQTKNNGLKSRQSSQQTPINNEYFALNCLLNTEVKNFKQILKQYVNNYRSSMTRDTSIKNSTCFGSAQKSASSFMTKSCPRNQSSFPKKEDEIKGSLQKGINKKSGNAFFKEFLQMTQKSQDYLEYYLKSSFVTQCNGFQQDDLNERNSLILQQTRQEIDKMLKKMDKNAILSVLRSSSKCLQPAFNPKEIINRILLAININPMNEFHFIKQETFVKFRKLSTGQASRKESKEFLVRYFCLDSQQVKKSHFDNLLYCVLSKLLPILNESTVQILFGKLKKICEQFVTLYRSEDMQMSKKSQSNKENSILKGENTRSGFQPSNNRHTFDVENERSEKNSVEMKNCKTSHVTVRPSHIESIYKREEIKAMMFQDTFGMWDEVLQLIFIV